MFRKKLLKSRMKFVLSAVFAATLLSFLAILSSYNFQPSEVVLSGTDSSLKLGSEDPNLAKFYSNLWKKLKADAHVSARRRTESYQKWIKSNDEKAIPLPPPIPSSKITHKGSGKIHISFHESKNSQAQIHFHYPKGQKTPASTTVVTIHPPTHTKSAPPSIQYVLPDPSQYVVELPKYVTNTKIPCTSGCDVAKSSALETADQLVGIAKNAHDVRARVLQSRAQRDEKAIRSIQANLAKMLPITDGHCLQTIRCPKCEDFVEEMPCKAKGGVWIPKVSVIRGSQATISSAEARMKSEVEVLLRGFNHVVDDSDAPPLAPADTDYYALPDAPAPDAPAPDAGGDAGVGGGGLVAAEASDNPAGELRSPSEEAAVVEADVDSVH